MYGDVVLGLKPEHKEDRDPFERDPRGARSSARGVDARHRPARRRPEGAGRASSRPTIKKRTGIDFPTTRSSSCSGASAPCSTRWKNDRADRLPPAERHPADWGTAVNVQSMVFGNMGDDSRHRRGLHPQPGHRRERVLRRVPDQRPGRGRGGRHPHARRRSPSWRKRMPAVYKQLLEASATSSRSTTATCRTSSSPSRRASSTCCRRRNGKRTGFAAVRIAVDMVDEKLITEGRGAAAASSPRRSTSCCTRSSTPTAKKRGRSRRDASWPRASPPAPAPPPASIVFFADDAEDLEAARGETVHPRPPRDQPRGHPRHARGRGHPHRPRRHDLATRRWSPGRWARCASSAATRSRSTTTRAP